MGAKGRKKSLAILTEDLERHPAIRAWRAATSHATTPTAIHVLREGERRALYWLHGMAPDGTAVFAKRAEAPRTILEATLYQEILPNLSLSAPRCYGSCLNRSFGWLFVQDVGDQLYSPQDPGHRALAARWLGTLHAEAAQIQAARSLPDAGPARYLQHLRWAQRRVIASIRIWPYPRTEMEVLEALLSRCDAIEAQWPRVEADCACAPVTVVHADFQPKNIYVRLDGEATTMFVIDWENVGLGPPAADLTRIDLDVYWSVVRTVWPDMTLAGVQRQAQVGRLFELLAAIDWESRSLRFAEVYTRSWTVARLGTWLSRLDVAARDAGLLE